MCVCVTMSEVVKLEILNKPNQPHFIYFLYITILNVTFFQKLYNFKLKRLRPVLAHLAITGS